LIITPARGAIYFFGHDREKHGNIRVARSTLVISRDGTVRFASISGDYRWRVGPEQVLAVLKPSAN
jgi:peroxiredoxin